MQHVLPKRRHAQPDYAAPQPIRTQYEHFRLCASTFKGVPGKRNSYPTPSPEFFKS